MSEQIQAATPAATATAVLDQYKAMGVEITPEELG
jgi:hypothetical protein